MVRSAAQRRVSNHKACILRDGASRLLRMRLRDAALRAAPQDEVVGGRDKPGHDGYSNAMMNIADRKQATAAADAQRWLESFATALSGRDAGAVAELFIDDGLWRDVLAFTWNIQTMAGRAAIEAMLSETLARAKPANFHIPAKRTPPRWVTRAGRENIETLFDFETAFGPANGILRLVPDAQGHLRAWTLNTNLHELRGHEEEFKRRAEPDSTRSTARSSDTRWAPSR